MSVFSDYEQDVVERLLEAHLSQAEIAAVVADCEFVSLEHTGVGYFLTVSHAAIPKSRVVCHEPLLVGTADGFDCGFVIFLERGELTLECHSWGDGSIPADVRDRRLVVGPAA